MSRKAWMAFHLDKPNMAERNERIRMLFKTESLSIQQLAKRFGLSQRSIDRILKEEHDAKSVCKKGI